MGLPTAHNRMLKLYAPGAVPLWGEPSTCPGGSLALGGSAPEQWQVPWPGLNGQPDVRGPGWGPEAGHPRAPVSAGRSAQSPSPPQGPGVALRARPPPSPPAPPAPPRAPSSGGPRGGSAASEEHRLLADRRGMSSGGSRHVTRRRSSSSPSRGSNFQPPPWEQRRAPLAPPAGAGGCGRGPGGAEAAAPRREPVRGLPGMGGGWRAAPRQASPSACLAEEEPFRMGACGRETGGSPGSAASREASLP